MRVGTARMVLGACVAVSACATTEAPPREPVRTTYATDPDWYAPPPPVRTFPTKAPVIHQWIQTGDSAAIRAHAWDLWESITSPSPQDTSMPVWETWYSGHEIFDSASNPSGELRRHTLRHRFEISRQRQHVAPGLVRAAILADRRGPDFAERWFSFNRYTRPTAQLIYKNRLWDWVVLRDTNQAFNRLNTPVAQREVKVSRGEVDPESFVLKPVFLFIDGTKPSCVTYWNGNTSATTSDTLNPIARTWKQFVIVDPTNVLRGAATAAGDSVQQCPPGTVWPVVPLSRFYSVVLTQEMVDSLSLFSETSGDVLGAANDTGQAAILAMAKAGNIGLLVAMHVTGKEISEWTWQTFWWSPTPSDSLGFDRPSTIRPPWNNYQMNTAYQMVTPAGSGPKGTRRIAFNPYLETSLCEKSPYCAGSSWYGVTTNCMSCHRMAAWKDTVRTDSTGKPYNSTTSPPYVPAQWVNKADPNTFGTYTKTDFLWSVAIRTRHIPPIPK